MGGLRFGISGYFRSSSLCDPSHAFARTFGPKLSPMNPQFVHTTRLATSLLTLATAALVAACGSSKGGAGPTAQSPERQSESEYDLARDYFYKGQPRVALDHAQKALELNDENSKALYFISAIHLSFCSSETGMSSPDCRLADAEKYARQAVKSDETLRDAKNLLGQILILEKKYADAIAVLEPLTRDAAYESIHLAWGNLGWAQVQNGQLEPGIASLRNAVTQPRFCVGHYRLGVAFEKKGDLQQAESALTQAVSVESPDCQNLQDAWEARARVRTKLGRMADARADLTKCREISQDTRTGKACVQTLATTPSAPAPSP